MKTLIVGGGIGGLTAALCLAKSGHQVTVIERTRHFSEVGAGIQCGANAVRVFDYLGLIDELITSAVEPERIDFREYLSGEPLYTVPLGQEYADRYEAPYYHLHRADLLSVLLEAVRAAHNIALLTGVNATKFIEGKDKVTVVVGNGDEIKGDALIACDGVKSVIRKQLMREIQPKAETAKFTGNVAWRATVPTSHLPANFMDTVVTNFVGPNKHMVLYYLRKQKLLNMVGVVEDQFWTNESWVETSPWEKLRDDFSGWHPMVDQVISAVRNQDCFRWALYDHRPLKRWSSNRVTLLGDAAHSTLPFMASGAAMAIEDARILQRSIDQTHHLSAGLQLYERNRIGRTTAIQKNSKRLGRLYHIENRFLLKAAFIGLKVMGGKKENFLPEYDANNIVLI